jgi:hypothetical protein
VPEPEVLPEPAPPVAEPPTEVASLDLEPEPEVEHTPDPERAPEPSPEPESEEPAATPETPVEPVAPLTPPEPPEARQPFLRPVEPPPPVPELSIEPLAIAAVPEPVEEASAQEPDPEPYAEPRTEHEIQAEPELLPAAAVPDDRDALIESLRDRVDAQEQEIAVLREQLEQERERKDVQVHVWPEEQPSSEPPAPSQPEKYLLCVPTPAGYVLLDREGVLPKVGEPVAVPEQNGNFTVTKVVRLPRNGRLCAYLQRA